MKKISLGLIICLVLGLALGGCGGQSIKSDSKPVVYTSFYPIYNLTKQVAGSDVEVKSFMPLDKEPHEWEPSAKDIKNLSEANMLIVNGAGMEPWLKQVEEALPDLKIIDLSKKANLIEVRGAAPIGNFQYMAEQNAIKGETYKFSFGHTHEDTMRVCFINNKEKLALADLKEKAKSYMENKGTLVKQHSTISVQEGKVYTLEMGHLHGDISYTFPHDGTWVMVSDRLASTALPYQLETANGEALPLKEQSKNEGATEISYDPHSWLSLSNAIIYVDEIKEALSRESSNFKESYEKNAKKLTNEITALQGEYEKKFTEVKNRKFVSIHPAYGYIAKEFKLNQFSLQGLISTDTPSLKTIKKAIQYCEINHINTIFYEVGSDQKAAETLAEEIGAKAEGLLSMEFVQEDSDMARKGYVGMMKYNLEKIYQSLK